MTATVVAVAHDGEHRFSKPLQPSITLLTGLGVEGDAHLGATVQHRSRVAKDPTQPNLRQVHLIHTELFDELAMAGYHVCPGQLGENVATRGLDLLGLSAGTTLRIGPNAVVEITGLRNPCKQIDQFQPGLLKQVVVREADREPTFKAGVMGVVLADGKVSPGDRIDVLLPTGTHRPLQRV